MAGYSVSPRSECLMTLAHEYGTYNYAPLPLVVSRGEGVWVWDTDGEKYLDMLSAYSALNFGHRHPCLVEKAKAQLEILTLVSRAFYSEELSHFTRELALFTGLPRVVPMNSGAEAVETAIKIARRWGVERKGVPVDKGEIIVFTNNFHGRTTTIISFSDSEESRRGFGPFTPGFRQVPYGDIGALESNVSSETVAILIEPIQGEGGVIIPPKGYLSSVAALCARHNILFIDDEIQTGFGRTGRRFCTDHEMVVPDMYIMGKSLGGGIVPISAVAGKDDVMSVLTPGSHGSTFGGNPFACAIAREVLALLEDHTLYHQVETKGTFFLEGLSAIGSPLIREVRGKGLLCAIEIDPAWGKAKKMALLLMGRGVLCKDTRDYTLRFAPPLTITYDEVVWALEQIRLALHDAAAQ
jgi:ornithine--oxo-acid transaminase